MSVETLVRPREEQTIAEVHDAKLVSDVRDIYRIRRLAAAEGVTPQTQELNYDPSKARAKFERLMKTNPSPEEIARFIRHEEREVDTALRERHNAAHSVTIYTIGEDGEIYNELFYEPFTVVLQRGLVYQRENKSKELRREEDEFVGWLKVCTKFLKNPKTKVHDKAVVFSGRGLIEETNYKGNVIDIYEVLEDPTTHKRYIKMVRHSSGMTYDQYWEKALLLEPNYFNGIEGPIDAWFLKHPFFIYFENDRRTINEIFEQVFERQKGAIDEDLMRKILSGTSRVRDYYINALCQKVYNPREIARAWNATLVTSDNTKDLLTKGSYSYFIPSFTSTRNEILWLSMQEIAIRQGPCPGSSAGLVINDPISQAIGFLSNSVGRFGVDSDRFGSLEFTCPHKECGKTNRREHNRLRSTCQHCGREIAKC